MDRIKTYNGGNVKLVVDRENCKGCGLCAYVCPKDVIRMSDERDDTVTNSSGLHYLVIDNIGACIGCGSCAVPCGDRGFVSISKKKN